MNKALKEKLGFIIRIINKYNYRVMFLKENEKPYKNNNIIFVSPPKYVNGEQLFCIYRPVCQNFNGSTKFATLGIYRDYPLSEKHITHFLRIETDCIICYSTLDPEAHNACLKCKAIICNECLKQKITQCPICTIEWFDAETRKAVLYDIQNKIIGGMGVLR